MTNQELAMEVLAKAVNQGWTVERFSAEIRGLQVLNRSGEITIINEFTKMQSAPVEETATITTCKHCNQTINSTDEDCIEFDSSKGTEYCHIDCAVEHDRDSRYNACCCNVCMSTEVSLPDWF